MTEQLFTTGELAAAESLEYLALFSELEKRCKVVGFGIEKQENPFDSTQIIFVNMPCGKEKRQIHMSGIERLKKFLDIPFEKYTFLSEYEAICNYADDVIEASIRSLDRMPNQFFWRRILGNSPNDSENTEQELSLELISPDDPNVKIRLAKSSNEFQTLYRGARIRPDLTIQIFGTRSTRHDDALLRLVKLANAFFFQLETNYGVSLSLEKERSLHLRRRVRSNKNSVPNLIFPKYEYDEAAISLYWYGCSAIGMPLLQFLSFYQVLEYYFPAYSQAESKRRIMTILKNPLFRADRDSDIGNLLAAISNKAGGLGDERSQLRATIQECTDSDDLRNFISSVDGMSEFIQKKKGTHSHPIPLSNTTTDLRNDISERIYQIRCKIVHTKADSGGTAAELLLPFSKEAGELSFDVALIQHIARQALITASTPLTV
jgi:hypothetical protein